MHGKQGILVIALGTLVSAGAIVAGCSDDPATTTDAGTAPTGTTTASGTTTGTTPADSGPAGTLYDRLPRPRTFSPQKPWLGGKLAQAADLRGFLAHVVSLFYFCSSNPQANQ